MTTSIRTDHRPWPIPSKPWRMKQTWHTLLFAHWPIAIDKIQPFIPSPLRLDVFEGQAWIAVVPFDMSGIRLNHMPTLPFTSKFAELNVRTYVTIDNKPGVYFFSLDATNILAVKGARAFYHLPYYLADIELHKEAQTLSYQSKRRGSRGDFQFHGSYRPISPPYTAQSGTLEHWLTERYCLYANHKGRAYRCDILHDPWPLQHAEAEIYTNTMANINGLRLPDEKPVLHYAERLEVLTWGLEQV
ncbi:YqjF family protein [Cohnella cholangitidis]|nr:DUF2071 domain-containing protein [Cohnella cholangitidis]